MRWQNSCWIDLPCRNCMSSMISRSISRSCSFSVSVWLSRMAVANRHMKYSAVRYTTRARGLRLIASAAMACNRCVLPSPTDAWTNSGLKRTGWAPPASATDRAAASATRFDGPSMKLSKV